MLETFEMSVGYQRHWSELSRDELIDHIRSCSRDLGMTEPWHLLLEHDDKARKKRLDISKVIND